MSYGSKTYTVYMVTLGSTQYRMYIRDQNNVVYQTFFDGSIDINEGEYADNNNIMYSVYAAGSDLATLRLGHPVSGATITPAYQPIAMGGSAVYQIHIPCSYCTFTAKVFRGTSGDDPPFIFFNQHETWSISRSGGDFTVTAVPWDTGTRTFVLATEKNDTTVDNYFVYGKFEGYNEVDNPPSVTITVPSSGQVVSGTQSFSATATDDKGINRVEFYVDGALQLSDTTSPYSYSWNTTLVGDGSHTLEAHAYDTASHMTPASLSVTVDNLPPSIASLTSAPASPGQVPVTISASITDVSSLVSTILRYSDNGGSSWTELPLANTSGSSWQADIPAHDAGTILYRIQATDGIGRLATSPTQNYVVTDQTAPQFGSWNLTPNNLTEHTVGSVRVTVSVWDTGGSGLSGTPSFDYRFGGSYDGYEPMTLLSGTNWYFDIPAQDWDALQGLHAQLPFPRSRRQQQHRHLTEDRVHRPD